MTVATLTVDGDLANSLSLEFAASGSSLTSLIAVSGETRDRIVEGKASDRDTARLMPQDLLRVVRQWYHANGASGTLAIVSRSAALDVIPWERLPSSVGLPELSVVRVLPDRAGEPDHVYGDTALLVAGWIGTPRLNLPGIQKELTTLGELSAAEQVAVHVMAEPAIPDLLAAWKAECPQCVHIAAPAVSYNDSGA